MSSTVNNLEILDQQGPTLQAPRDEFVLPAISRRTFLVGGTAIAASLLLAQTVHAAGFGNSVSSSSKSHGAASNGATPKLTARTFSSPRHKTRYLENGPSDGPLMIFLHGWPEIGMMWHTHMEAFASEGWHCVAPDMRGYGGSSAPKAPDAYTVSEVVKDMVELHDHLGGRPAVWVGHDLGSPIAGALAAHHAERSRAVVLISVPYIPGGFALPSLVPLIDRKLYPADQYPDGQWDYYRFYLTHFEQTVTDFDADIPSTLASIYHPGNPASVGKLSPSALITRNGGRYGSAHRAPPTQPDPTLWSAADFDALTKAYQAHGFRPVNAWYLNDIANIAYARSSPKGGRLHQPVLFLNGEYDGICDITRSALGQPMRDTCHDLTVDNLTAGHWLPIEHKAESIDSIRSWLKAKGLS